MKKEFVISQFSLLLYFVSFLISYNIWNLFIQSRNVWPIGRLFAVVFVDTPYFTVSQCRHLVDTGPREEPQVPLLVQPYCTYDATSKTTGLFLI